MKSIKGINFFVDQYTGVGGIERSVGFFIEQSGDYFDRSVIYTTQSINSKYDVVVISSTKYKFLFIRPLIVFLSFFFFLRLNKGQLLDHLNLSRSLAISAALCFFKIKHTFIPPAVTNYFYKGILSDPLIRKMSAFKRLKKKVIIYPYIVINNFFERIVLKSKYVNVITFSEVVKLGLKLENNSNKIINVNSPGISSDVFYPLDTYQRKKIRDSMGYHDSDFIVIYVGRTSPGKNVTMLFDAFNQCKIKDKQLLIIGGDNDSKFNHHNVKCLKSLNTKQLRGFYNIADVLALPTEFEGFGHVLLESLGCGTPIVGFDTPTNAISEILKDDCFGHSSREVSIQSLIELLLIANKNKASNRSMIASRSLEVFTWGKWKEFFKQNKGENV
jgi:glycosyltransferase involved in cell wall biosynthesis